MAVCDLLRHFVSLLKKVGSELYDNKPNASSTSERNGSVSLKDMPDAQKCVLAANKLRVFAPSERIDRSAWRRRPSGFMR